MDGCRHYGRKLYNPDNNWIFPDLFAAHAELDAAVEAAYGVDFNGDEEAMVAHLFTLYAEFFAAHGLTCGIDMHDSDPASPVGAA